MLPTIAELSASLANGGTTSRKLTEGCLERILDAGGEGSRAFTRVYGDAARADADAADRLRGAGIVLSPIAGLPVSVKDLFDVAGETTLAGSVVLKGEAPAVADAEAVGRLRRAGAVIVGKTNMTEFAFSGLGLNPHYGTPRNAWDRALGRIPGGSSAGAAVSVTDGMAAFAIGTDTGGSVRIPAALCGLVGFKPTARRVASTGCFPLSRTLDSIGPIARTVACCAVVDRVLSGDPAPVPAALPIAGLRLGVPRQYVFEGLDPEVASAFAAAVSVLSSAGARVVDLDFPELLDLPAIHKDGGFAVMEAYAIHRRRVAEHESKYDPRVASRIVRGRSAGAAEYLDLLDHRAAFIRATARAAAPFDALLFPAAALVAPPVAELEASDEAYFRANARALRNTTVVNFFDGCALSLPCHAAGAAPVGLMVAGCGASDDRVLSAGLAIESVLAGAARERRSSEVPPGLVRGRR
jgi:aspartyl-tRNA(Asn)/glutamyl-tRNA(Gln) amidotransferase subunit A